MTDYTKINIPCLEKPLCDFSVVPFEIWGDRTKPMIGVMGESPYIEEVKIGRPFVGRSGQLLREVLDPNKFSFFIFNSVACLPRNAQGEAIKPTEEMVRKCIINRNVYRFYLPKGSLIILLGRFAAKTALGDDKLPFGIFVEKDDYTFYTAYHPSYGIRGISNKIKFIRVLKRINVVKDKYYEVV